MTTTETTTMVATELLSPDTAVMKTEVFDVDFARQLIDDKSIPKEERDKLRRYVKNRVRGNQHDTTYKLGRHCKHEFQGRFCALRGESLQGLGKDIRNAIGGEFYWDIDFVNAQPTLLRQYAKQKGWSCQSISLYIEQRDELLTSLCETMNIERWEAKEKVIAMFFGCGSGAVEGMTSFFVDELYPELRMIMKNNWEHNKSNLKWLEKQPNHVGKALAYILQSEERKCLIALDRSLARVGRRLDVYIHDGGLVFKKEGETALPSSFLRELETEIEKETGYALRLSVKPMKSSYIKLNQQDDYQEHKEEFEKTHFKLMNPPRYVRQIGSGLQYLSDAELNFLYRNDALVSGETFVSKWIADPSIRTYEKLEFKPKCETTEGCFNLFQGFPLEAKEGDWSIIHELVWDLSGRNQDNYDYIINWSAHLFQKPYEKPGVMIIFSSTEEGVGKDTYGDHVLKPLLSSDYYMTTNDHENEVFGRFTSHLQNKLLVKLEEMNYDVMSRNDDKLKGWITCETKSYEEKGISKSPNIESFHRFIGTTNEACPVKLTKTFRRYLLINPYQQHANNTAHWDRIYTQLKKPDVLQAFYHYLINKDISGWTPRQKCETDALNEARQSQAPPLARFFQSYIQENHGIDTASWYGRELLVQLNTSCKFPYSPYKLSQEVKMYPHTFIKKNSGNQYRFELDKVQQFLVDKHWWVDL